MGISILLCNYTESEQNCWRFLLRNLPGISLNVVEKHQLGSRIQNILDGNADLSGETFSDHLAVFCGASGPLLSHLIDLSGQVYRQKGYRATLTDTNANWTLPQLLKELKTEEAQMEKIRKK